MPTLTDGKKSALPDMPYTMRFSDGRTLAVLVPGRMTVKDLGGELCFTPAGTRFLDQLQDLFMPLDRTPSPALLRTLREALSLTQEQYGDRAGVDKMTVYRWERGELKPAERSVAKIQEIREQAIRHGVTLPG
jgi:DNA-binding XRE family transcriptional regulator